MSKPMITPKSALQGAIALRRSGEILTKPPLAPEDISLFEKSLPGPIPADVRELFEFASGFQMAPIGDVDFRGGLPFEYRPAFPAGLALAGDSFGNFWVLDVRPDNGAWGPVFFVSHDPPVIVKQAVDLADFITKVTGGDSPEAVIQASHSSAQAIWEEEPFSLPAEQARVTADPTVRQFAGSLGEEWYVVDLRNPATGTGFSWGRGGPKSEVRRLGADLVFGVRRFQRQRGILGRLFGG